MAITITTTNTLEGRPVTQYLGVVAGETILGVNVFKDIAAGFRNIVGGRSGSYESVLREGKKLAIDDMCAQAAEMGANAVIGVDIDYEVVGDKGSMLMVAVSGTAVRLA